MKLIVEIDLRPITSSIGARDRAVVTQLRQLAQRIADDGVDAVNCTRLVNPTNGQDVGDVYLDDDSQKK